MLTPAEWDVIDAYMRGETRLEIRETLHLSYYGVRWRELSIRSKLNARTWTQAVGLAVLHRRADELARASADVEKLVLGR